jgi:histidine phosphotransfer protein HptB
MAAFLDEQQLAELMELMGDDFDSLVEAYLRDSTDRLMQLERALADGNFEQARRQAHSLKGSSSNLGARQLVRHCQQIEAMAGQHNEPAISSELGPLREQLAGVQNALRQLLG